MTTTEKILLIIACLIAGDTARVFKALKTLGVTIALEDRKGLHAALSGRSGAEIIE